MNVLFEISDTLLIGIGAVFLLLIIIIAFFIKAKSRKIKPIDEDDRYDADEISTISVKKIPKDELNEEQLEAKLELERVYEMMSRDLENQNTDSEDIEEFEREQEENAIISYQELMKQAEKLKKDAEIYEMAAEEKADMEVREAINTLTKKNNSAKKRKVPDRGTNFRSSDIVSPIYGVQSNKSMFKQKNVSKDRNNDIISKAYKSNDFDNEKTQNLDFLNSLKSFRKNL